MADKEQQILQYAEQFRKAFTAVKQQIAKAVIGQHEIVEGVLITLFVGGNVLLEGVPGLGKTLLIRTLSQALNLQFSRIQFTPDLMPADITGTTIVVESPREDGTVHREFQFQRGPIFANIVLADEINRATPKTQSAMLEAMQERSVTVGGTTYPMPKPFFVMATQNPIEQEGTYPLPEAQLDRFFFKLQVGYVSRKDMHGILNLTTGAGEAKVEPVLDGQTILKFQQLVRHVIIAPHIQDYAIRCVLATHPEGEFGTKMCKQFVRFGASPRAGQALVLAGKCRALIEGRAHVSAEDINAVILPAMRHRILMNFEGQAESMTPDMVLEDVIEQVQVEAAGTM
jgi:MoxR-like ATPase